MYRFWARHIVSNDPHYHDVVEIVYGGSFVTRCSGRWPERDAIESHDDPPTAERDAIESHDDPPTAERCGACDAGVAASGAEA